MKKLTWFTHTNISSKDKSPKILNDKYKPDIIFDLTEFLPIFISNKIWEKDKYRLEYNYNFNKEDIEKIQSIKIIIHNYNSPLSNFHNYENVISQYFNLENLEPFKIGASSIHEASKIAVIEIEFDSKNKIIDNLSYVERKDEEKFSDVIFTSENGESWCELRSLKSIICEFIQFFNFNMHLNFSTTYSSLLFSNKPNLIGFSIVSDENNFYYETDKINLLSHYILYEKDIDILFDIMRLSSKFWHKNIASLHFFLDALQGENMTCTNFIKLVFTIESFFKENTSNDYISKILPLVVCKNKTEMEEVRKTIKSAFNLRNKVVHGGNIFVLRGEEEKLFFLVKNIIINLFSFYVNEGIYLNRDHKLDHEFLYKYIPNGFKALKKNS